MSHSIPIRNICATASPAGSRAGRRGAGARRTASRLRTGICGKRCCIRRGDIRSIGAGSGAPGNPLNERADQLATEARRKLVSERRGGTSSSSGTNRPDNGRHMDAVALYVRGCALGVPGPGGYAAVLVEETGAEAVASGHWPSATNNVMELWAVIAGLRTLKWPSRVTVYTPSKYLYEGASRWLADWERRRWRTRDGRPVKNREVWTELVHMMGDHDISWKLVPAARAGVHGERAARVARQEAEKAAGQAGASAGE